MTADRAFVVVGAGWIGAEVAASARQRGMDVALIDPQQGPTAARNMLGLRETFDRLPYFYSDQHDVPLAELTAATA